MELKTGYKQTEIGVIPSDWTLKPLSLLSAFITKGSTPTTYGFKWEENGVLFLRSECVSENGLDLTQSMFISEEAHKVLKRSEIKSNDILITITGYVGRVIYLNDDFGFGNINQHIAKVRIVAEDVERAYIYHYLTQPAYRKYFDSIVTGQAYPQISLKQVREASIPLPPTKAEQTAIATALSDTDQYITHLEKLIAKKRNIKQGAMQELLKPKEGWVVKKLGEVADLIKESIIPINFPTTEFSHFSLPAFDEGGIPTFESGATILSNKFKVPKDAILVAKLNPRIPRVWMPIRVPENAIASTEFLVLLVKKFVTREYLYTVCKSSYFFKQMELAVTGTTGSHQRINPNDAMQIEVCFPQSVENQTRIATTLSDMDSEITTLESKLSKAQSIKLGMMQQLLTGIIRLV